MSKYLPPSSKPNGRVVTASARARVLVPGGSTPSRSVTVSPCVVLGAPGSQAVPSQAVLSPSAPASQTSLGAALMVRQQL